MSVTSEFEAQSFLEDENLSVEGLVSLQKAQLRAVVQCLEIKMPLAARKDALVQAISTHLGLKEEEKSVKSSVELEKYKLEMEFKKEQLREERAFKLKEIERKREKERKENLG